MDALNVYNTVCLSEQRLVEANVIHDICYSLQQVGSGFACHGSQDGNLVVHFLATLAISSSSSRMWVDVLPKFLGPFVKADISSL